MPLDHEPSSRVIHIKRSSELTDEQRALFAKEIAGITAKHSEHISPISRATELQHLQQGNVWLALDDADNLAGFVHMIPTPTIYDIDSHAVTWLAALYLKDEHRGGDRTPLHQLLQTALNAHENNYIVMDSIRPKLQTYMEKHFGFEEIDSKTRGRLRLTVALNLPQIVQSPSTFITGFFNPQGTKDYKMLYRPPQK